MSSIEDYKKTSITDELSDSQRTDFVVKAGELIENVTREKSDEPEVIKGAEIANVVKKMVSEGELTSIEEIREKAFSLSNAEKGVKEATINIIGEAIDAAKEADRGVKVSEKSCEMGCSR